MTPKGFKAWVRKAGRGRQIIYFQGQNIQLTDKTKALRDAAYAAYEAGDVILCQKRLTPLQGLTRSMTGTFAYMALRI